jgi:hypothetical protein
MRRREGRPGRKSPYLPGGLSDLRSCPRGATDLFSSAPANDRTPIFTREKDFGHFFEKASPEGPPEVVGQESQAKLLLGYENAGEKIAFSNICWRVSNMRPQVGEQASWESVLPATWA